MLLVGLVDILNLLSKLKKRIKKWVDVGVLLLEIQMILVNMVKLKEAKKPPLIFYKNFDIIFIESKDKEK